jgi:hypothetical protein
MAVTYSDGKAAIGLQHQWRRGSLGEYQDEYCHD